MKSNPPGTLPNLAFQPTACRGVRLACHKAKEEMARLRTRLFQQSAPLFDKQRHLVRLALNEAESLAWQTRYPHLVFPSLAQEKLGALAEWSRRQAAVRHKTMGFKLAAQQTSLVL